MEEFKKQRANRMSIRMNQKQLDVQKIIGSLDKKGKRRDCFRRNQTRLLNTILVTKELLELLVSDWLRVLSLLLVRLISERQNQYSVVGEPN